MLPPRCSFPSFAAALIVSFLLPPPPRTMGGCRNYAGSTAEAAFAVSEGRIAGAGIAKTGTAATGGIVFLEHRCSNAKLSAGPGHRRRSMRRFVTGGGDDGTMYELEVDGPAGPALAGGVDGASAPSLATRVVAKIAAEEESVEEQLDRSSHLGNVTDYDDDDDIGGISIHEDAFGHLGVVPPQSKYPRRLVRFSWRVLQRVVIPLLHAFDPLKPTGKFINVECIWCKVISSNDPQSPTYDYGVTYDMLPPITRMVVSTTVVRRFGWLVFPRWVHPLFELRTAYLDGAIAGEVARVRAADDDRQRRGRHSRGRRDDDEGGGRFESGLREEEEDYRTKIRIVSFGAGYDARCVRLSERLREDDVKIDEYYELDLPEVVDVKRRMMGRERLLRRRRRRGSVLTERDDLPVLIGVDLNDVDRVRSILDDIVTRSGCCGGVEGDGGDGDGDGVDVAKTGTTTTGAGAGATLRRHGGRTAARWHTIFVFEAVLMYLNEGVAGEVLRACSDGIVGAANVPDPTTADGEAGPASSSCSTASASLCFADRIENVPGVDVRLCRSELRRHGGWDLVDWTPNSSANARHMGTARCASVVGDVE